MVILKNENSLILILILSHCDSLKGINNISLFFTYGSNIVFFFFFFFFFLIFQLTDAGRSEGYAHSSSSFISKNPTLNQFTVENFSEKKEQKSFAVLVFVLKFSASAFE